MHDLIHAAIASQRTRDLVETGATRRAVRERKDARTGAEKPVRKRALGRGAGIAAALHLRRGVM